MYKGPCVPTDSLPFGYRYELGLASPAKRLRIDTSIGPFGIRMNVVHPHVFSRRLHDGMARGIAYTPVPMSFQSAVGHPFLMNGFSKPHELYESISFNPPPHLSKVPTPTLNVIDSIHDVDKFILRMSDITPYTKEERMAKLKRYKKKLRRMKLQGNAITKTRYVVRQQFAMSRPRIGGRFCNKEELNIINSTPELLECIKRGQSVSPNDIAKARLHMSKMSKD